MPREKAPAYQRYPKQIMGDDKVLLMDWDAYGMHNWLLDTSWQQDPRGTIPNDQDALRRWLRLPQNAVKCTRPEPWCRCNDCTWRRVWPQISAAWPILESGRRGNLGMIRCAQRQKNYSEGNKGKEVFLNSTQIGTQTEQGFIRKSIKDEDVGRSSSFDVDSKNKEMVASDFDGQIAFRELCKVFPRPEDDQGTQVLFMQRVQADAVADKCSEQQAFDAIIEKARLYADMVDKSEIVCVYGLKNWLYKGVYKQGSGMWLDSEYVKDDVKRRLRNREVYIGAH